MEDNCINLRKEVENLRLRIYTTRGEVTDKKTEFDEEIKQLRLTDFNLVNEVQTNTNVLQQFEKMLEDKLLQRQMKYESKISEIRTILENEQKRCEREEQERMTHIQDRQNEMMVTIFTILPFCL